MNEKNFFFRTLLFVPGNNSKFFKKARSLTSDIICFDLEDSVPMKEKENARNLIKQELVEYYSSLQDSSSSSSSLSSIYVRTNPAFSEMNSEDLQMVIQRGINGIVIPKTNTADEIKKIEKIIASIEVERNIPKDTIAIIPSIESAQGVVNCYSIASSSKRIVAVVFGVFDLLNDLGIEYSKQTLEARYAREKIPIDAKAAGVTAIDAIWQDLKDIQGFKQDCKIGKNLGYSGKSIIHPDQIDITHDIYRPTKPEIEWAYKVYTEYEKSIERKIGAITIDGKMIDEVHYKQAKAIIDLASNDDSKKSIKSKL